jgi:hypothetical protein
MKKASVIYLPAYEPTPLSFWVHRHLDADAWMNASQFDPPLPRPVPGQGWAQLVVEFDGVTVRFSSSAELNHFVDVLSRNPLPTTKRLAELRGTTLGPNSHWLSRLPARAKPRDFRERLIAYLERVRPEDWR